MKIIPKMQLGGGIASLSATYDALQGILPRSANTTSKSSSKKSDNDDSEKGKITEKDLVKTLDNLKALPNEIDAISLKLILIEGMTSISSVPGASNSSRSLATQYTRIVSEMKKAAFNKEEYDNAYKQIVANNGLNEFVVTQQGALMAYNKDGELQSISVNDYLKNKEEYSPITNSNLLWLRAHDPQFINNNLIFTIVSNGIGIDKVNELIKSRITTIGTSELSLEGYSKRESGQITKGIQVLDELSEKLIQDGMTIDGLYKTKVITKDLKQQVDSALKYIYSTLPENAKTILALHSGNSENPQQGALEIIGQMLMSKMSPSTTVSLSYESELNPDGSKRKSSGSSESDGDDAKDTYNTASLFLMGKGQQQVFEINPGTDLSLAVLSNQMPLSKPNGDPLGKNHSLKTITESMYSPILDFDKATMGGAKINPIHYGKVIIESDKISSIDFPIDENGNPDLRPTTIQQKKQSELMMLQAGIDPNDLQSIAQHYQEVNQIMQDIGISAVYDSKGNIVAGNWKRFAVMNATADNRALGMEDMDDNNLLLEITDDSTIDQLIEIIKTENDLKKYDFDKDNWYDWNGHDSFYRGTIWIPLNENYFMSQSGSGEKMKMQQIGNINQFEIDLRLPSSYNKPPTL